MPGVRLSHRSPVTPCSVVAQSDPVITGNPRRARWMTPTIILLLGALALLASSSGQKVGPKWTIFTGWSNHPNGLVGCGVADPSAFPLQVYQSA
jgi:hypothetical protein